MAVLPKFSSIKERKRYYADAKFGPLPKPKTTIDNNRNMTNLEYNMLNVISQTISDEYTNLSGNELVKIPYFTNNVQGINIFKENKLPTGNDYGLYLSTILQKMILNVLENNDVDPNSINMNNILLHLTYPIQKDIVSDQVNMVYDSMIVRNDGYTTVKISDVILYAMVKDCSKYFMALSSTEDVYLIGSDIMAEDYMLSRPEFDAYFITLTKTIFATTLIGRNIDQLGLMDYPAYQFSVGTYFLDYKYNDKFLRTHTSHSLVHVLPLWGCLFHASFLLELATTNVHFSYQHDTLFSYYEKDIETHWFKQVSDRTENIMAVPVNVSLSKVDEDVTPLSVYNANINVRNKLSTRLFKIKNFNKIKDKMYPKNRNGAKTKLQSCLSHFNVSMYSSVLDIGSAPGTWLDYLLTHDHFSLIQGVTCQGDQNDLSMYPEIISRVNEDSRASIAYADAIQYLGTSQTFDLIVSDLATKHLDYLTQSLDHDYLYTKLLLAIINKLNIGGSFIMKMYDLTPDMYGLIAKFNVYFKNFKIIKPNGSCPTNPEMYLIGIDYTGVPSLINHNYINSINNIILSQICNLTRLLTQGFGLQVNYDLFHINNRLQLTNVEYIPYHLTLCLGALKFSEYLYPTNLTGIMQDEVTLLGDRYLRINWDVPKIPDINTRYVYQTSIGYESNAIGLQNILFIHHGLIFEDGIRKLFFIVEKEASCLFSDIYDTTCITTHLSNRLPINQLTISMLLQNQKYRSLFPNVLEYGQLDYYVKQLSLSKLVDLQQYYNTVSSNTILNQFFRESETMRLFYTKSQLYTSIKRSKNQRTRQTLDMSQQDDRKTFVDIYKSTSRLGKTLRQTFFDMLNEYTIQIGQSELLTSSICTTKRSYIEHKTGQICVSQPACVQFRRQQYIFPI